MWNFCAKEIRAFRQDQIWTLPIYLLGQRLLRLRAQVPHVRRVQPPARHPRSDPRGDAPGRVNPPRATAIWLSSLRVRHPRRECARHGQRLSNRCRAARLKPCCARRLESVGIEGAAEPRLRTRHAIAGHHSPGPNGAGGTVIGGWPWPDGGRTKRCRSSFSRVWFPLVPFGSRERVGTGSPVPWL
jgi:hypothetical protein